VRLEALERRLAHRNPRRAAAVRALAFQCEGLFQDVRRMPAHSSWGDWIERFAGLVAHRAVREDEPVPATQALQASLTRALELLRQADLGVKTVSRKQMLGWVRALWRSTPLKSQSEGIQVIDARLIAGIRVGHLFLVGLEEGRFPQEKSPSLVSDEMAFLL